MSRSTELVMQALGDEDGFKLAETLFKDGPQTQTALADRADVDRKRAGDQLQIMRAIGLVERERPARGKWSIAEPAAVAEVFASAARLAAKISASRTQMNEADLTSWEEFAE